MPLAKSSSVRSWLRLALLALCVAGIVYIFRQNRQDLKLLLNVGPWNVAALAGLFVSFYALLTVRYRVVFDKIVGVQIGFWEWFRLMVLGIWLNVFFPQLGNVYRGVQLKKLHGVAFTGYISSYVALAWLDTCVNLLVTLVVLLAARAEMTIVGMPAWAFVLALLGGASLVPVVLTVFLRLPGAPNRRLAWMHAKASQVVDGMRQIAGDLPFLARVSALGVVVFAITTVMFGVCFLGLGVPVSLPALAMFCALYKLSTYVIITPGNLGLLELGCAVLGDQTKIGSGAGLLACGMLRVAGYMVLAVLATGMGGLGLIRERNEIRRQAD